MTTVVIAPHPDDEALGCGGVLVLRAQQGVPTIAIFLTSGELGAPQLSVGDARRLREDEACAAAEHLCLDEVVFLRRPEVPSGLDVDSAADTLRPLLERFAPDVMYLPHPEEWHPDHAAAMPIIRSALRGTGLPAPTVFTYEVWNPLVRPEYVEDVTAQMPAKLRAVRAYRSQLTTFRYDQAVRGLNRFRGELGARTRYAEAFGWTPAEDGPDPEEAG